MGSGRVGVQRPRVRRQLQGTLVPQDQGAGTLAQGCSQEPEPAQGRPDTVHLDLLLVEGQAEGGAAEQRGPPLGVHGAKVVEHLDGVPLEREKVALGGHLAHQRQEMVGGQQRFDVAGEREEVGQIVRLVDGAAAAGQEMALARRPVEGPNLPARIPARRATLPVPQHERLDDRGRPLEGRLSLQVDPLPPAHFLLGPRVARQPGHLQGERVGVRPGWGDQVEGEPQVVPGGNGGLLGGHGGRGETRPVRRGVQGPRESGEYLQNRAAAGGERRA